MSGQPVSIGSLRWLVTLAMRKESPTFGETGITEDIVPICDVHVAIEPIGLQAFIASEQIDSPISHLIYLRWQPFQSLSMFNVVLRTIALPDNSLRIETYRIRRAAEWNGRHRYVRLDCELEKYSS